MPIVLAENFQNFKAVNLPQRYPGSTVNTTYMVDGGLGWGCSLVVANMPTTGISRREIYFTVSNTITLTVSMFGVTLSHSSGGATNGQIRFNGNSFISSASVENISWAHVIIEVDSNNNWTGTYINSNGPVVKDLPLAPDSWNNSFNQSGAQAVQVIRSIIVVDGTDVNTKISNIVIEDAMLSVPSSGAWQYSDQGFVQDTSKADETITTPNIYLPDSVTSSIQYDTQNLYGLTNWYVNGLSNTITPVSLTVNGASSGKQASISSSVVTNTTASSLILSAQPVTVLTQFNREDMAGLGNMGKTNLNSSLMDSYSAPWTPGAAPSYSISTTYAVVGGVAVSYPGQTGWYIDLPAWIRTVPLTFEFVAYANASSIGFGTWSSWFRLASDDVASASYGPMQMQWTTTTTFTFLGTTYTSPRSINDTKKYVVITYTPTSTTAGTTTMWMNGTVIFQDVVTSWLGSAYTALCFGGPHTTGTGTTSLISANVAFYNWRLSTGLRYTPASPPPANAPIPFPNV